MTNALSLANVTKRYGANTSVDAISLEVPAGAIVALLGPNGAGKSTTMKMCAGFIAPDEGTIAVAGKDIAADRDAARLATTFLPENVVLYEELTGRENLEHLLAIGSPLRLSRAELDQALITAGLQEEAITRRASTYSKGMRQKVGLALALSRQSALLLLDEPTSGLDPHSAAEFNAALRNAAAKGVGVLMATHDIWRAREVATQVLVMTRGRIALQLDPANLSAEEIERRFFAAIAPDGADALFLAGDMGQRIFQHPYSWASLGVDVRGRSHTLKVCYRTSQQIRRAADHLLPRVLRDVDGIEDERKGIVSVFDGPTPRVETFISEADEAEAVRAAIAGWLTEGIEGREIGIFVRTPELVQRARSALPQNDEAGSIVTASMHLAKGLEFRAVAVMACDEGVLPLDERVADAADEAELDEVYETERRLLYVACTRAREHLFLTGVRPASEYLDDFNSA